MQITQQQLNNTLSALPKRAMPPSALARTKYIPEKVVNTVEAQFWHTPECKRDIVKGNHLGCTRRHLCYMCVLSQMVNSTFETCHASKRNAICI